MLAVVLGAVGLIFASVLAVEAHTCSSLCNQVRRACRRVAHSQRQVARAVCDATRDTCRADCEANADTCQADCEAACVATCAGDAVCVAGCPDACVAICADCIPDCNADRTACFDLAEQAREAANLACDGARTSCGETCVDPIDGACVRTCKSDRKSCDLMKKNDEKACKRACPNGEGRRACMRECRRLKNAALALCSDTEVLCLLDCASGVD
jgi:hypothetical protein